MRTKTVKRYYCEHCSKGSFKIPSMVRHEMCCIKNPVRSCPLCENTWDDGEAEKYIAIVNQVWEKSEKEVLDELARACEHCPACILSALVQFPQSKNEEERHFFEFDYKVAKADWDREQTLSWGVGLGGY